MLRYELYANGIFAHTGRNNGCDMMKITTDTEYKGVKVEDFFNWLRNQYLYQLKSEGFYLDDRDEVIDYGEVQEQMNIKNAIDTGYGKF